MAPETYWNIRQSADSVSFYVSHFMQPRTDREKAAYPDLWLLATSADLSLERAYGEHGCQGVLWALNSDESIEHWLSKIGAEIHARRTGDRSVVAHVATGKPPGEGDVLPQWSVENAHLLDKAEHLARRRHPTGGGRGTGAGTGTGTGGEAPEARRRRPGKPGAPTAETSVTVTAGSGSAAGRAAGSGAARQWPAKR